MLLINKEIFIQWKYLKRETDMMEIHKINTKIYCLSLIYFWLFLWYMNWPNMYGKLTE
jgi:hypothetical protein